MTLPEKTGILGQKTVSMLRPPQIPYIVDWGGTRAPVAHHTSLPTETVFNEELIRSSLQLISHISL